MRWIRWGGLGAFVAIVGGLVLLWLVFADGLVRWAIEGAGSRLVGARVELEAAEVGFSPARLELRGLAVTNPRNPMRNALEAERIAFDLDWVGLMLDRVWIDTIGIEGIRFGTERARSGAMARTERAIAGSRLFEAARRQAAIPPLEVPSAATVLERESLNSPEAIAQAGRTVEERRRALEARLQQLPGQDDLERHRSRLDAARTGEDNPLKRLKRVKKVAEAIEDDVKSLRRARDEARADIAAAREAATAARRAPVEDIERLYRKYTDPRAIAGELAHYLLGPTVVGWIDRGWYWYDRVRPFVGGGETGAEAVPAVRNPGRNIVYPRPGGEPDVLVRQVILGGAAGAGELGGRISDIAMPANRWPQPLRVNLDGRSVAGIGRLQVDASLDARQPGMLLGQIQLAATGRDITGLTLGPEARVRADRGRADFRLAGTVRGGELDLDLGAVISGAGFAVDEEVQPVVRELAGALSDAGGLRVDARVTGTIDAPRLRLDSSLEDLAEPILRRRLQRAASGFREQLAVAVTERSADPLASLNGAVAQIEGVERQFRERLGAFEDALKRAQRSLD